MVCYNLLYCATVSPTPKPSSAVGSDTQEDRLKSQVSQENTGESVLNECSILNELQVAGVADVVCLDLELRQGCLRIHSWNLRRMVRMLFRSPDWLYLG